MACIGRIPTLAMSCGAPLPSFNRIAGAKVLNAADISSFTVSPTTGLASITRVADAVGLNVTTVNNALTITLGIKSQDIMSGAYDVTVTMKHFGAARNQGVSSDPVPFGVVNDLAKAEIVIAVDHGNGLYRVYGLGLPLVCLEYSLDSTTDGYVTVTYGVEDWQIGTTVHLISKADYDALSTPQPTPEP
nr:MAG TPA: hypothetical protein [Caudoviricetes sp.]